MKIGLDLLKFAVNFAQADLKAMRPGDKMNLRDDLYLFAHAIPYSSNEDLEVKAGDVFLSRKIAAREMSDEQLAKIQAEFFRILQGISMPAPRSRFAKVGTLPTLDFCVGEGDDKRAIIFAFSGDPRDVLLYRLIRLLESSANTRRLQLCPECGRIFLKVKRQKYCSQKCANRAYMREYRAINGESDSNHKQYAKRKQKQAGKPVNVIRHPRRS